MFDRLRKAFGEPRRTEIEPEPTLPPREVSESETESAVVDGGVDQTVYCSCGEAMRYPTEWQNGPVGPEPMAYYCPKCDRPKVKV